MAPTISWPRRALAMLTLMLMGCSGWVATDTTTTTSPSDAGADAPSADPGPSTGPAAAPDAPAPDAPADPWAGHGLDDPYDTSHIVLVGSAQKGAYTGDLYENRAYTCGHEGYQNFLVVYPTDLSPDVARPLWVRLHGGAPSAFAPNGDYIPEAMLPALDQEPVKRLLRPMKEGGLMDEITHHPAGFRFLFPSLCDDDLYSGVGIPDVYNPYSPDENGNPRAADGLLATQAAIAYTRAHYTSTHTFIHGTSAGSIGSFGVAYALERKGLRLSGIVADSHVIGRGIEDNAQVDCMIYPYPADLLQLKIGPLLTPEHLPDRVVAEGGITVPIYHVWNRGDPSCCGSTLYDYVGADGTPYSEAGCTHEHRAFHEAILAHPPGGPGVSQSVEVCVNAPGTTEPMSCNQHAVTKIGSKASTPPGDQLHGGRDQNEVILQWVNERLQDPPP